MEYLWTGKRPENRAPSITDITLDGRVATDSVTLASGQIVTATVTSEDPEGESLDWQWVLMDESRADEAGGDAERIPQVVPGRPNADAGTAGLTAPMTSGAYRPFVYTRDDGGGGAHANLPFLVD